MLIRKTVLSLTLFTTLFTAIQESQATLLSISQTPLVLSDSVPPNLILTLDDSGSMRFSFIPDAIGQETQGHRNYRRAKSAAFNSMYYDPSITYEIPLKIDSDGAQASTGYDTSFTQAYHNGFNTGLGSIDLSGANYRVGWDVPLTSTPASYTYNDSTNYSGSGTIYRLAENPAADFQASVTLSSNGSITTTNTSSNITFSFTRTSSTTSCGWFCITTTVSCTATANHPNFVSAISASCSVSGNTLTASLSQVAVPAYYYTLKTACTNTSNDDCYQLHFVANDDANKQKNFAIWYSFYRNRALATLSAANLSFNQLPSSVRLTWQTLNSCTSLNSANSGCGTNYFRAFSGRHRGNFFSWLTGVTFDSGTPLRTALGRAGEFLKSSDAWAHTPNPFTSSGGKGTTDSTLPTYACRPSYHIMMTDGMWNGSNASPSSLKPDHSATTLPDGRSYSKQHPFNDDTTETLADLAFHYWATDANTSLGNELKPYAPYASSSSASSFTDSEYWDPRNDPATWQHLVNYTVGLGLTSSLKQSGLEWNAELGTFGGSGYDNLKSGNKNWPAAAADNSNNVYDLWHTAINSRGEFFSVDDPDSMVAAFKKIIERIGDFTTSASNPAVTASQVDGANAYEVYETEFSSEDWSGDLIKFQIETDGTRTQAWSARSKLKTARTVKMANAQGDGLQNFTWSNLSAEQQAWFHINPDSTSGTLDNRGEDRVEYIRGVRSNEGSVDGTFRSRDTLLGDIVNSSPVRVGGALYLAYLAGTIDGNVAQYAEFQQKVAERKEMIYVGANDGMLHGFNAETGEEEFAFIPSAVLPNLYRLSGQAYQSGHRFYVNNTPVVADVYFANDWHTVLIGTLGAGGRSLFALDITDPDNIDLLWEFTDDDMGYTFPQPTVARLHTGQWAVVTGNGYGNQSGTLADKAALFVIDVESGELVKKVVVEGDTTKANGLSTPKLADNDSDGIADYAYAGDLQGNLWRFDLFEATQDSTPAGNPFSGLTNTTADDIVASYGGSPLFTAVDGTTGATQPITAPPSLVRHPSYQGYLVMFGTGKYFEDSDGNIDNSRAQSVYAIWDRKTKAEKTKTPPNITRSDLLGQAIESELIHSFDNDGNSTTHEVRTITENTPTWYKANATDTNNDSSVNHWGWYLDLKLGNTLAGEMMVNPMAARGQVLMLSTLTPNDDPCVDGVDIWAYGLNVASGGRTTFSVFDFSGDGSVDSGDTVNGAVASGRKLAPSSGFTLSGDKMFSTGDSMTVSFGPNSSGRQSWQALPEEDE